MISMLFIDITGRNLSPQNHKIILTVNGKKFRPFKSFKKIFDRIN